MRIIAGTHRRQKLTPPRDQSVTRPMSDRVKQSMFDRLVAHGLFEQDPGDPPVHVVDLFAGTGSLGLEALSRGAQFVTFIEQDRDAAARLQRNLEKLDLTSKARLLSSDALGRGWTLHLDTTPISMVYLDPPYAMVQADNGLDPLVTLLEELRPRLATIAAIMLRTPAKLTPPAITGYRGPGSHAFGSTQLNFYITDTTPQVEPAEQ